jgi:hypothetical protein
VPKERSFGRNSDVWMTSGKSTMRNDTHGKEEATESCAVAYHALARRMISMNTTRTTADGKRIRRTGAPVRQRGMRLYAKPWKINIVRLSPPRNARRLN